MYVVSYGNFQWCVVRRPGEALRDLTLRASLCYNSNEGMLTGVRRERDRWDMGAGCKALRFSDAAGVRRATRVAASLGLMSVSERVPGRWRQSVCVVFRGVLEDAGRNSAETYGEWAVVGEVSCAREIADRLRGSWPAVAYGDPRTRLCEFCAPLSLGGRFSISKGLCCAVASGTCQKHAC